MRYKKMIGEKIYLTALTLDDATAITEWYNDTQITQFLAIHREIKSFDTVKKDVEAFIETGGAFAIFHKKTDILIGYIVLDGETLEIFIGKIEYYSKDIFIEAVNFLLDFGFNIKNCNILYVCAYSHNTMALSFYEAVGFKKALVERERLICGRNKYDKIFYDMLASEYFQREKNNAEL